jgi:peptidoglycan LD-endopeptidase LytH
MLRTRRLSVVAAGLISAVAVVAGCGTATPSAGRAVGPVTGSATTSATPSVTPSPSTPTPSASAKMNHLAPAPTKTRVPERFAFPVVGHYSYAHVHHDYPATDIIAPCGSVVRAATSGVVLEVTRVDKWNPKVDAGATRGGLSVSIRGDDGVRFYGSHMSVINANIRPGVHVTVGQPLGKVGETGDASACHLHFGLSPVCTGTGDWWIQRGVIWPWPYLDSWRAGGNRSPVAQIATWQRQHGCPTKPLVDP